jgi:hypothetical protein
MAHVACGGIFTFSMNVLACAFIRIARDSLVVAFIRHTASLTQHHSLD